MIGQRAEVRIPSHGEQLAAYRYTPDRVGASVPCVVMAHGFSATRDDGLPAYAEAFRDAGFAVILFDYRHFGASTDSRANASTSAASRRTTARSWIGRENLRASILTGLCCGARRSAAVTFWRRRPPT